MSSQHFPVSPNTNSASAAKGNSRQTPRLSHPPNALDRPPLSPLSPPPPLTHLSAPARRRGLNTPGSISTSCSDNKPRGTAAPPPQLPLPAASPHRRQTHHFTPSLNKRHSGISDTSSLTSASAEFDGDISIVAPLGQEENTDLCSVDSLSIAISTDQSEGRLPFSVATNIIHLSDSNKQPVFDTAPSLTTSTESPTLEAPQRVKGKLQTKLKQSPTRDKKSDLDNGDSHQRKQLEFPQQQRHPGLPKQSQDSSPVLNFDDAGSDNSLDTTALLSQTPRHQPSRQHYHNISSPKHGLLEKRQLPQQKQQQQQQQQQQHNTPATLNRSTALSRRHLQQQQQANHPPHRQNTRSGGRSAAARTNSTTPPTSSPSACPPRMATSLEDISSLRLWKGIVAEFVGTLLLTLVGCGSCINLRGEENDTSPVVQIALCFGLSVATVVWAIAHVSGGHVNPAVTCAMLAARKVSLAKAAFFIVFQLLGAVVGAGILYGLTPHVYRENLGATLVSDKITPGQGLGVELLVTFVLVFTVFASCDGKRKDLNGSAPLTIGLSVTMCHLWAIDYTGSSMNTARSFGPALILGKWEDHWVYWAGPIAGGVLAGLLYEHLFAVNASVNKAKAFLLTSDYDDEKYRAKKLKVRIIEEDEEGPDTPGPDDNGSFPLTEKDADPSAA